MNSIEFQIPLKIPEVGLDKLKRLILDLSGITYSILVLVKSIKLSLIQMLQYSPAVPATSKGDVHVDPITLKQRQGLGIGGVKGTQGAWYVVGKDLDNNVLQVAQGNNHPSLFSNTLWCSSIYWVDGNGPDLPLSCTAKTRYRQADQACTIAQESGGDFRIDFNEAQRAVTPGQSVVFYLGDVCLGGGIIERTDSFIEVNYECA